MELCSYIMDILKSQKSGDIYAFLAWQSRFKILSFIYLIHIKNQSNGLRSSQADRIYLVQQPSSASRTINYRPRGYERVHLPLYKVADTPFYIQGDVMFADAEH